MLIISRKSSAQAIDSLIYGGWKIKDFSGDELFLELSEKQRKKEQTEDQKQYERFSKRVMTQVDKRNGRSVSRTAISRSFADVKSEVLTDVLEQMEASCLIRSERFGRKTNYSKYS